MAVWYPIYLQDFKGGKIQMIALIIVTIGITLILGVGSALMENTKAGRKITKTMLKFIGA